MPPNSDDDGRGGGRAMILLHVLYKFNTCIYRLYCGFVCDRTCKKEFCRRGNKKRREITLEIKLTDFDSLFKSQLSDFDSLFKSVLCFHCEIFFSSSLQHREPIVQSSFKI